MAFPNFFNQVSVITLRDPLAQFLGATPDGLMTYHYEDAVKLCGHSCPTVSGAYAMLVKGLHVLYGSDTPERGGIEVRVQGVRNEGTAGVTSSVATLITGAATELGFGGIGMAHRFARRNLLDFAGDIDTDLILRRRDTGKTVKVSFNGQIVPFAPEMRELMPKAVGGDATAEELHRFGELWQARVKAILVDEFNNPELIRVQEAD